MNTKRLYFATTALGLALGLAACGGGAGTPAEGQDLTVEALDSFQFDPSAITASVGDTVNVTLDNTGALEHNFVLTEFNVSLGPVPGGQTANGSFTPDAAGTYEYFCDVPGHREAGMVGTLTVNP